MHEHWSRAWGPGASVRTSLEPKGTARTITATKPLGEHKKITNENLLTEDPDTDAGAI